MTDRANLRHSAVVGVRGCRRAAASAETAGPGRELPVRLHFDRVLLHAVLRHAGRDRRAAERHLPLWMDLVGLVLLARRRPP
jgi:hypothetical protein